VDTTVPLPFPAFATVSANAFIVKVAVTDFASVNETVQEPVPEHAPVQPVKIESEVGAAASETEVPALKFAAQVLPQEIPAGVDNTEPLPVPAFATVSANTFFVKVAVTDFAAVIETVQAPEPEHAPAQPVKTESEVGVAVRVRLVPRRTALVQVLPQLIPAGFDMTVPEPVPLFITVKRTLLTGTSLTVKSAVFDVND